MAGLAAEALAAVEVVLAAAPASVASCSLARAWAYASEGTLEVEVSRLSGETEKFMASQWTTVRDLKDMVAARLELPAPELVLLNRGQELKGDRDVLAAYRLTPMHNTLQALQCESREGEREAPSLKVWLRSAPGIPDGSMVSIRAGTTRRQSTLKFGEPYTFPVHKDAANPFKVDVYSLVGRARVQLLAGEDSYTASLENGQGLCVATLEFEARDNSEKERRRYKEAAEARGDARSESRSDGSSRAQRSVQASQYMDQHGLFQFLQGLVQSLLSCKPEDPYRFMIEQMQTAARNRLPSPEASPEIPEVNETTPSPEIQTSPEVRHEPLQESHKASPEATPEAS